jgi:Rieske 2Fe-2S family protein
MRHHSDTQAPLDGAALERAVAPFGFSRNLPQDAYTSDHVLQWELHHLYESAWVCVGRADDLAQPGDYRAIRIGNDGIILGRDAAGTLRGFYNVCSHRAHEILEPGQCTRSGHLRCSYHGWTYNLDGSLEIAPRSSDLPGFDPASFGLPPARVELWHGWVFVNASGDAPPLEDWIGELEETVAPYEPERLRLGAEKTYEVAANWKLVHENYHECYHCPQIHPQLCRVSPPDSGVNFDRSGAWIGGSMALAENAETMSLDGQSAGVMLRGLSPEQRRKLEYYAVLPNVFLSLQPDYVLTHRIEPLSTDRTKIECQWLFPPEAFAEDNFSPNYAFEFWDVTNLQDWRAIESVQRGISSRGYRPGPLAPREDAVYRFVSRIARAYLDGGFSLAAPAPVSHR